MISVSLPYPPSANRLWRNFKGRTIRSAVYRAWLDAAASWIESQGQPSFKGRYVMTVVALRPDRRKRDLSNLIKATEDALVHCGVIEDDSLATEIRLGWSDADPKAPGALSVTVEAA